MSSALEFYSNKFDELAEVVRTVDVLQDNKRFRIDILRGYSNNKIPFFAKYWIVEEVEIHPVWTEKGDQSRPEAKKKIEVLRKIDLPWVNRNTDDEALSQALGFLESRSR